MRNEIVWEVDSETFELLHEYGQLRDNEDISEHDYIEKLRMLGMPDCGPGDHLRIVHRVARRKISLPSGKTLARLNGGTLPGLPH